MERGRRRGKENGVRSAVFWGRDTKQKSLQITRDSKCGNGDIKRRGDLLMADERRKADRHFETGREGIYQHSLTFWKDNKA